MKIRKATLKDAALIAKINTEAQSPVDKKLKVTEFYFRKETFSLIKNKLAEFFLLDKSAFVCFNSYFPGYKLCELYYITVSKKYQKKGIGTKLLKFIETYAKKKKFRGIYLYTHPINKDAIIFYKERGYKKINEFPKYYSNGDKSLLFGKKLK